MDPLLPNSRRQLSAVRSALATLLDVEIVSMELPKVRGRFNDSVIAHTASGTACFARVSPDPVSFPYLQAERNMLAREALLSQILCDHEPFPPVRFFDSGVLLLGPAILVRELYPGLNGDVAAAGSPLLRDAVWRELRSFDAALPALDSDMVGFPGQWSTSWSEVIGQLAHSLREDLRFYGITDRYGADFGAAIAPLGEVLDRRPVRVCHGDLWPKNTLITSTETNRVESIVVLDWERAFVGDPLSQWLRTEDHGFTMLSIDRSSDRHAAESLSEDERLVAHIYCGVEGLLMLAESVRNPIDPAFADRLVRDALSKLRRV